MAAEFNHNIPSLNVKSDFLVYVWNVPLSLNGRELKKRLSQLIGLVRFIETFEAWIKRSNNMIIEFCSMESVRRFAVMMSEGSVPFLSRKTGFHDLATFGRQQFFELVYRDTGVDILRTNGMPPSEWQLQIQRRKNARTNSNINDGVAIPTVILRVDLTSQQTQERIVYDRTATNSSAVAPSAHGTSDDLLAVLAPPPQPPQEVKEEID
ncbi:hypothetical protein niasHT_003180 [Heterodera trifolii]|uniref:Uncharacterized protein n=1 Tax=Heterodera trifolii TaxID=157864 RepID=A0ABD2MEH2_9BILA